MTYDVNNNNNNENNKSLPECPFSPKPGYTTAAVYTEYAVDHPLTAPNMDVRDEYALLANMDQAEPLYFWQLYSVLGPTPIRQLVTDFYQRVFDDDEHPGFVTNLCTWHPWNVTLPSKRPTGLMPWVVDVVTMVGSTVYISITNKMPRTL